MRTLWPYYDKIRDVYATNGYRTVRRTRKTGLTDRNVSELNDAVATCTKIQPAADQLSKASDAITDWEDLVADAGRISSRASDVLNADYGNGAPN